MANHRAVRQARGAAVAPNVPGRLSVTCPSCGAAPAMRCFRMTSWVDVPGHPDGGYYTDRLETPHNSRRSRTRVSATPVSERGALRKQVSQLAGVKLSGNARMMTRQWANSSRRTAAELSDKVRELSALTDVPPTTRLPHQRQGKG